MDMRRRLVHVQVCGEDIQVGITILKAPVVLVQGGLGPPSDLRFRTRIVPVPDLQDQLVKRLLLTAGANLFIIVFDLPVGARLPGVVAFPGFIEQ